MSASNPLLDPAWVAAEGGPPSRRRSLARRADRYCDSALREFLGGLRGEKVSRLEIWYAVPTAESWAENDFSITCALYDREGPTVGSLKGIGARALEQNENVF